MDYNQPKNIQMLNLRTQLDNTNYQAMLHYVQSVVSKDHISN